jgi:hypothetical protein
MLLQIIGFLLVGRLLVFILQEFPFHKIFPALFGEGKFLKQLLDCPLCLGVWVYWFFSILLDIDFIYQMFYIEIPILNNLITGVIASFIVYIFCLGWFVRFGTTIVE